MTRTAFEFYSSATEEEVDSFTEGFERAAPSGYDLRLDAQSSTPWCCPWFWCKDRVLFGNDAKEMGCLFATAIYKDLAECLDEDKRMRESIDEDDL